MTHSQCFLKRRAFHSRFVRGWGQRPTTEDDWVVTAKIYETKPLGLDYRKQRNEARRLDWRRLGNVAPSWLATPIWCLRHRLREMSQPMDQNAPAPGTSQKGHSYRCPMGWTKMSHGQGTTDRGVFNVFVNIRNLNKTTMTTETTRCQRSLTARHIGHLWTAWQKRCQSCLLKKHPVVS